MHLARFSFCTHYNQTFLLMDWAQWHFESWLERNMRMSCPLNRSLKLSKCIFDIYAERHTYIWMKIDRFSGFQVTPKTCRTAEFSRTDWKDSTNSRPIIICGLITWTRRRRLKTKSLFVTVRYADIRYAYYNIPYSATHNDIGTANIPLDYGFRNFFFRSGEIYTHFIIFIIFQRRQINAISIK